MGITKLVYLLVVLIFGILELSVAVKPKGKKSSSDNAGEVGSVEVSINWRTNYDEEFIRLLYNVVDEDESSTTLHTNSNLQNSTQSFLCTHCGLVTDDQACHEKYEVCITQHGCYRHVFIKYGQRFLDKGCWHQPIGSLYGKCKCHSEMPGDQYSCFCETCSEPMCNSEIILGGNPQSRTVSDRPGFVGVITMLLILFQTFY